MNSEFTIAVHSLVFLANLPDHMATSEEIAANVSTHSARIRKVMGFLRKAGYVSTKEGIGGGFILCRNPDDVTLGEIYRLTCHGSLKPSWCSGDEKNNDCMISSKMDMLMGNVFADAEKQMESYFDGYTIGSMLERIKAFGCPQSNNEQLS
ncbi:RrF2 family transcriptional regulator [Paenibacillus aceris]|uniref:Rrf2 family protein n=1 Tax=Paenibacillus aceris TaxID=869555 RepID=A0ABS4I571_9BACL|nr:Rrf2 family transcriptional regulator [Paenibacillus aceris]MBP1966055.1 Rrf2 family protein [Paenibacillus aceris]NHW39718.1 Rrf2 family transcriptional regulator [Paenibacillus aceris]